MTDTNKNYIEAILEDEELKEVIGGWSGHVGQYDGVIGQTYYFVNDQFSNVWIKGILKESYEKTRLVFWSKRVHVVEIIEKSQAVDAWFQYVYKKGDRVSILGEEFSMYHGC